MPSPVAAARIDSSNPLWNDAAARGGELAQLSLEEDSVSWEFVGTRGIIATALYALAHRDGITVAEVGLDALAWPLFQREDFLELATSELVAAGHNIERLAPAAPSEPEWLADPVLAQWQWLNRYWKTREDVPRGQVWDGLPRGVARGLRWPAIDVCLLWAGNAVGGALAAERGALERRTPVAIIGGEFAGQRGFIESAAWKLDQRRRMVAPGAPAGYMINLGGQHRYRVERVLVEHLTVESGQPGM